MRRSNEPIFWGLFGAGGMLTAFVSPVLILITGILLPLGLLPADALDYQQLLGLTQNWLVKGILLIIIALPLWHTMHRIFHGLHDVGVHFGHSFFKWLCYGFAFIMTVATATLLVQIG